MLGSSSDSGLTSYTQCLATCTRYLLVTFDLSEPAILTLQRAVSLINSPVVAIYNGLTAFCRNERGVSGPDINKEFGWSA